MSIEFFSNQVASRRVDLEVAEAAHEAAKDAADRLRQRVDAIRQRSAEITAARLDGTAGPESAAELYALGEDVRILDGLHRDAEDHAETLRPDRERAALAQAEGDLRRATEEAKHAALVAHAREIEALYLRAVRAVQKAARQRGARTIREAFEFDGDLSNALRLNSWLPTDRGA